MSHLSRDERLLALDGALDATRQGHLAACAGCRADVEALASVVARVKAVDVPEPSPLFWDHLAARVGDAIAREPAPERPRWWAPRPAWGLAAVALIVTALAGFWSVRAPAPEAGAVARTPPGPARPSPDVAPEASAAGEPGLAGEFALADDAGWRIIEAMADDAGPDAFAPPVAGGSELTIAGLSADERAALILELEAALAASGRREG
jgi:hypothetical protein